MLTGSEAEKESQQCELELDCENSIGVVVRMLIINQQKNKMTDPKDLCKALSVNKYKLDEVMKQTKHFLAKNFEIDLIRYDSPQSPVAHSDSYKYFLRKNRSSSGDNEAVVTQEDKRRYTLFVFLQIENNCLKNAEAVLKACVVFKNVRIDEWLKSMRRLGYIQIRTDENELIVSFSWRYYIDYGDWFNIAEYLDARKI